MPLLFERNDIIKMNVDAIVIPANEELKEGTGTSRAIFLAAGEDALTKACDFIGFCRMGDAVITKGFNLPAKYIIHAVCPRWFDGTCNERELLYSAYTRALEVAAKYKIKSIAFPLLSAGNYGYPKDQALNVASHAITDFLMKNEMEVHMVFFEKEAASEGKKLSKMDEHIDDEYAEKKDADYYGIHYPIMPHSEHYKEAMVWQKALDVADLPTGDDKKEPIVAPGDIRVILDNLNDPFSVKLSGFVKREREKGRAVKEIYTCSNVRKKQFYKLMEDPKITPKKTTVMGLCVGLRLSLKEAKELMGAAGYLFSESSGADMIVAHYIKKKQYNHAIINLELYENNFENFQIGLARKRK